MEVSLAQALIPQLNASSYLRTVAVDRKKTDPLIRLSLNHLPDTLLVQLYERLAYLYMPSKNDSTVLYANRVYALSHELNYREGIYQSHFLLAQFYENTNQLELSLQNFLSMAAIAEQEQWTSHIYQAYGCIANNYFISGNYPAALRLILKGKALAEKNREVGKVAFPFNSVGFIHLTLGNIHLRQGNTPAAKQYYQEFYDQVASVKDSIHMYGAKVWLAEVFLAQRRPREALQHLFQAQSFYEKKSKDPRREFIVKHTIPRTMFTIAKVYNSTGENQRALDYCLRAFDFIYRQVRNTPKDYGIGKDSINYHWPIFETDLADYFIITGKVYEDLDQRGQAILVYRQGLNLALRIKHAVYIRNGYGSLARLFGSEKKYDSAYRYERLFNQMKDSIVNVRTRIEIQQINAEYNIAKKDQEIEQQKKLYEADADRQQFILNSLIGGLVFLSIISWLAYNRYRLKQQNKLQQSLTLQRSELFSNFINTQTAERIRLARDIHDHVGTLLSAAKLKLSDMEENTESLNHETLSSSLLMLDQAAAALRNISHNLMPASLSRLGLVQTLDHFFTQLNEVSSIKINFGAFHFDQRLDETLEINLYPMVLELTNNAIKHSRASNLNVQLIKFPEKVNITVEDDGSGFDYQTARRNNSGIGLSGIESRVEFLKASFSVDSVLGRGTLAVIDVPLG